MMSMFLNILQSYLGLQAYCSLLKRGMKTLYFQQSSSLFSSWQIWYTLRMAEGWKDRSLPSMSVRNFCFISGVKYSSDTLQYLRKNFSNSLGQRSQTISSILAQIFFQKSLLVHFNFFMRQYMGRQSFFLILKKLVLTESNALEIHAWVFQSCFSCPSISDSALSPSIISSYSRYSSFSKPSRISLGVSLFQCIFYVLSMNCPSRFLGFHLCLTRMGMVMGKVRGFLACRLGGRIRNFLSY